MTELDELVFKECAQCADKPGSPQLCESCLNNRAVIYRLKNAVRYVSRVERAVGEVRDAIGSVRAQLGRPKRCTCKKAWFENPDCKVHGR